LELGEGMESVDDSMTVEQDFNTIDKSKSKPVATSNSIEAFTEKDGDPSQGLSSPPPTNDGFQELTDSFVGYWWKGILACAIMVASLMAIILMLGLHQNRPLPSWPFTITLNSLVSIMVVILKSSMLAIIALGMSEGSYLSLSGALVYTKLLKRTKPNEMDVV
jgi:hypothetical protein